MNITLRIETILIAFRQLLLHPLRTILTIAGFAIAMASLLTMVGIGEGTKQKIIADMEKLGSARVISVQIDQQFLNNPLYLYDETNQLTVDDIEAIKRSSEHITHVVPIVTKPVDMIFEKNKYRGIKIGTTYKYANIRNWQLTAGRFLSQIDIRNKNRVCVIGSEVKTQLFGMTDPIGQSMQFGGDEYTVIGVMEHWDIRGSRILNQQVIIPISTVRQHIPGKTQYTEIFAKVDNIEIVPIVQKQLFQILKEKHTNFENFKVFSQSEFIQNLSQSSTLMSFTFGIISLIILLIGGIGIMNLLLVSVTERTKEIGIYKAIGAKDFDIFSLFLTEAIIMSCLGGGAGIILGVNGSNLIVKMAEVVLNNRIESIISFKIILLSLFSSLVLGIFFGIYPALNATKVDPGRALKYE